MGLRLSEVSQGQVRVARLSFGGWKKTARRAISAMLLGVGLWLLLRWAAGASPSLRPTVEQFMADGGGYAIGVRGVYAPEPYFRLARRDPAALGMDPAREIVFFVVVESHEHYEDLPSAQSWWDAVSLSIDGEGAYHPSKQKLLLASAFHQTVALAFPRSSDQLPGNQSALLLDLPDLGDGASELRWQLPIRAPARTSSLPGFVPPFLAALLPLLAGLLVTFSPCVIHMTTYYVPLFGGVAGERAGKAGTRAKMALVSVLFTLGFAVPYTLAGVVVGYAGQFVKDSSLLEALSQPLSFVAGVVVLYLGLQVAGVLRLPFFLRLNLLPSRFGSASTGYLASGFLGLNLAVGCLGCVGGSLFAALLLYSGAIGSPLEAGALLFLFALAANAPFLLAAITLGRFQLRGRLPLSITRHVSIVSGALLIALGLLILSGTESLMEDALIRALAEVPQFE